VNGWQVLLLPAGRGIAAGRWPGVALVLGDALVDAAVDLCADPIDQAGRYRVVIRGAEVAVRPDRRGDFFLTLPFIELKVLGIGMAAAVLIDATVVRGVLLPAALSLVGDSAWRLRRRADHGAAPLRYQHDPPRTTAHRPQHREERSRP
jgi:hypothetical protein